MRYRAPSRFTKKRLLGLLLAASVVALLLPTSITGRLMNLVQVLVPVQDGMTRAADRVGDALASDAADVPAADHEQLARQADALRHRVASLSARIAELEQANRELTGIRGRGLGPRGTLIPARVVADDLLAWRESALIDAGTLRGVQRGAAVASGWFSIDAGAADGLENGLAVLSAEVLVGWIEHAGTHTARVKRLSDPESAMAVSIGRFDEQGFSAVGGATPVEFWLRGAGDGRLEVIEVDHRYIEGDQPAVLPGDWVVTVPGDPRLPAVLTIGSIDHIRRDPDNGLLYDLSVESAAPSRLRRVYVLDASTP
ncbi:MAG: rod shape-determining protein MreC [Planctomycetes bacterium]|nr:rod shape-determining protein MreC [Planctomycetota bacterium]